MGTPEISIVVPVYNAEKYLRQCVDSVLAQTYPDWELILIDDGSSDRSVTICDEFATSDSRIKRVHTPNGGSSIARNNGIGVAEGKYITFLDADDLLHPQFIELALSGIQKAKADAVSFGFTDKLQEFDKTIEYSPTFITEDGVSFSENVFYQKGKAHPCSACGKLYKRSLFEDLKFTPYIGYEDLDIFYRLFPQLSIIAVSNLKLYYYRSNPSSYIHTFTEARKDVLDVTDRMKDHFSETGKHPDQRLYTAAKDRRLSANFNILGLMAANQYSNPSLESRCWNAILEERKSSLFNPRVRLKNKIAIFLSYIGGIRLIRFLSRIIYSS